MSMLVQRVFQLLFCAALLTYAARATTTSGALTQWVTESVQKLQQHLAEANTALTAANTPSHSFKDVCSDQLFASIKQALLLLNSTDAMVEAGLSIECANALNTVDFNVTARLTIADMILAQAAVHASANSTAFCNMTTFLIGAITNTPYTCLDAVNFNASAVAQFYSELHALNYNSFAMDVYLTSAMTVSGTLTANSFSQLGNFSHVPQVCTVQDLTIYSSTLITVMNMVNTDVQAYITCETLGALMSFKLNAGMRLYPYVYANGTVDKLHTVVVGTVPNAAVHTAGVLPPWALVILLLVSSLLVTRV